MLGSCAELQLMPWVDCTPISLYIFVCEHPRIQRGSFLPPIRASVLVPCKASGSGHPDLLQADALASSGPGIMSRDSCELRAGISMLSWELLWAEIVLARRGSIFFHAVFAAVVSI